MCALLSVMMASAGCRTASPSSSSAADDDGDYPPFQGAQVVPPKERERVMREAADSDVSPEAGVPVDRYIVEQLQALSRQVPDSLVLGEPEVLWFNGPVGQREGVVVLLLARHDVYGAPPRSVTQGPVRGVLTALMEQVGGTVVNIHRIPEDATVAALPSGVSLARAVYSAVKAGGTTGRIQNANRWVIASFRETDKPVEAFRPVFDDLWAACDALKQAQPVLIVGEQVLGRDDIRLKRLYERANRTLNWPTYAGSQPDPGLGFQAKP